MTTNTVKRKFLPTCAYACHVYDIMCILEIHGCAYLEDSMIGLCWAMYAVSAEKTVRELGHLVIHACYIAGWGRGQYAADGEWIHHTLMRSMK